MSPKRELAIIAETLRNNAMPEAARRWLQRRQRHVGKVVASKPDGFGK